MPGEHSTDGADSGPNRWDWTGVDPRAAAYFLDWLVPDPPDP